MTGVRLHGARTLKYGLRQHARRANQFLTERRGAFDWRCYRERKELFPKAEPRCPSGIPQCGIKVLVLDTQDYCSTGGQIHVNPACTSVGFGRFSRISGRPTFAVDTRNAYADKPLSEPERKTMNAIQKVAFLITTTIVVAADAHAGRWLSRDPIQEGTGFVQRDPFPPMSLVPKQRNEPNLYGFVRNNPIGAIDKHGLVTGSFNVQHSTPQFGEGLVGWSVRFDWRPPSEWPLRCALCDKAVWVQAYRFHSDFYWTFNWTDDWNIRNYQGNSSPWVNGAWPRGHRLDFSEMWDDPSVSGPILAWSSTIRFQAESCVRCIAGPDKYKWYGCISWGYSVNGDNLTGGFTSGPHDGPNTPFHW